jgi:site-specific recombinase XerD
MIESCLNIRDKAIVGVLNDTGIRVAELVALDICNVVKKDKGWSITVGYNRMDKNIRTIHLTDSTSSMNEYIKFLNEDPVDNLEKEPLFFSSKRLGRIYMNEVDDIVKSAAKRAEIKWKVTPYVFHHRKMMEA